MLKCIVIKHGNDKKTGTWMNMSCPSTCILISTDCCDFLPIPSPAPAGLLSMKLSVSLVILSLPGIGSRSIIS